MDTIYDPAIFNMDQEHKLRLPNPRTHENNKQTNSIDIEDNIDNNHIWLIFKKSVI